MDNGCEAEKSYRREETGGVHVHQSLWRNMTATKNIAQVGAEWPMWNTKFLVDNVANHCDRSDGVTWNPICWSYWCWATFVMHFSLSVDCKLGEWGSWSKPCSCDERFSKRKKIVLRSEQYWGEPCPDERELRRCNARGCNGLNAFLPLALLFSLLQPPSCWVRLLERRSKLEIVWGSLWRQENMRGGLTTYKETLREDLTIFCTAKVASGWSITTWEAHMVGWRID